MSLTEEIEIYDKKYFPQYFEMMNEFRRTKRFCDVTLCIDGDQIIAHKSVLSASSPYFHALFKEHFIEGKCDTVAMHHETTLKIMTRIINYIYSGNISISLDDASLLLKNFDFFQMDSAKEECVSYLTQNINNSNCLQLFILSGELSITPLRVATTAYVVEYLKEISASSKFKSLSVDKLESILTAFGQSNADTIFTAIMSWIKHDIASRSEYVEQLLKYVSISHLSLQHIRNLILTDKFLNTNAAGCKWLVMSFLRNNSAFILGRRNALLYIFSLGVDAMNYEFDVQSRTLVKHSDRPFLFRCATIKYKNTIYAIGGEKENELADFGLMYDVHQKAWKTFCCSLERTSCGICTQNDKLYALCGLNGNGRKLFSSLRYDIEIDRWTSLVDMKYARRYPGAAIFNSSIYVIGGYNGNISGTIVERYDAREGVWKNAGKVKSKGCCSAGVLSNAIYALEYDTEELINFDPRTMSSFAVRDGGGLYVTPLDGYLYSVKRNGISQYDPHLSLWEEVLSHPLGDSPVITG